MKQMLPTLRIGKLALLAVVGLGLFATTTRAQDDDVQGKRWYLDVKYSTLAPITMRSETGKDRVYWYTLLEVTNKTGTARPLDLIAHALTPEDKKNSMSRPGLYPDVTERLAKKHKKEGLENILALNGEIANGETKHIAIVFARISKLAHFIHVRVRGLTNSVYVEGKDAWRETTELQLAFHRIGDEYDVVNNPVIDKGKSWITIDRKKIR